MPPGDDESHIINYDTGSESVSLSGVSTTSTKKAALVFEEEKRDLSSESGTTISSDNRNLQNPIYSTSEFTTAPPLSQDRTLYNPVYEAVPSNQNGDGKDDDPEKVAPSPEDFVAPDDKTLVATTTATGTTTVHANGERYETSPPVPMEIHSEPTYATVIPKHKRKRATAKPFAADGDNSDSD